MLSFLFGKTFSSEPLDRLSANDSTQSAETMTVKSCPSDCEPLRDGISYETQKFMGTFLTSKNTFSIGDGLARDMASGKLTKLTHVFIKTPAGKNVIHQIDVFGTAADLLAIVEETLALPQRLVRLLFDGNQLCMEAVLFNCGVRRDSTIQVALRAHDPLATKGDFFVKDEAGQHYFFPVKSQQTIKDIKKDIASTWPTRQECQKLESTMLDLYFSEQLLQDSQTLGDYNISRGCSVRLQLVVPKIEAWPISMFKTVSYGTDTPEVKAQTPPAKIRNGNASRGSASKFEKNVVAALQRKQKEEEKAAEKARKAEEFAKLLEQRKLEQMQREEEKLQLEKIAALEALMSCGDNLRRLKDAIAHCRRLNCTESSDEQFREAVERLQALELAAEEESRKATEEATARLQALRAQAEEKDRVEKDAQQRMAIEEKKRKAEERRKKLELEQQRKEEERQQKEAEMTKKATEKIEEMQRKEAEKQRKRNELKQKAQSLRKKATDGDTNRGSDERVLADERRRHCEQQVREIARSSLAPESKRRPIVSVAQKSSSRSGPRSSSGRPRESPHAHASIGQTAPRRHIRESGLCEEKVAYRVSAVFQTASEGYLNVEPGLWILVLYWQGADQYDDGGWAYGEVLGDSSRRGWLPQRILDTA